MNLNNAMQNSDLSAEFAQSFQGLRGAEYLLAATAQEGFAGVFPELANCLALGGGSHHDETVFEHLVEALRKSEKYKCSEPVRLAALLHDVGKPYVAEYVTRHDGTKDITFHDHENVGADIAYRFCKKHGFAHHAEYVRHLVKHHMFNFSKETKSRTIKRWLFRVGRNAWEDLIRLRRMDREANKAYKGSHRNLYAFQQRARRIIASQPCTFREDLCISESALQRYLPKAAMMEGHLKTLINIVNHVPERNDPEWLLAYTKEVFSYDNEAGS